MNKRLIGTCFLAAVFTAAFSQSVCPVDLCNNKLRGKEIYIPKDLQGMDLQNPDIIRKSKFQPNPERSVQFSGKRTKRSVQKKGCAQHL